MRWVRPSGAVISTVTVPSFSGAPLGSKAFALSVTVEPGSGRSGVKNKPHALAGGHVPLIGHPARDLAPEAVVIEILHAAPPAPRGVDAHEEDLAAAGGLGDEQRDGPEFAAAVAMDGEDLRAALRLDDRGVPIEAGKPPPDLRVFLLAVAKHGQQRCAAFGGESERGGDGLRRCRACSCHRG